MSIPFLFNTDTLVVMVKGKSHSIRTTSDIYKSVRDALKLNDESLILDILTNGVSKKENKKPAGEISSGSVVVKNGSVFYKNKELDNKGLINRVNLLIEKCLPIDGMVRFIEKLYNNVSYRTRMHLLAFIDDNNLTIDSEGNIIAYKAVTCHYMDKWTGKINNSPGNVIRMDRSLIDDDPNNYCSKGLHAGSLEYVHAYGSGDDRIIIVKIDPSNVVSVPKDCGRQKMRVCEYYVLGDYNGELKSVVYDSKLSVPEMYEQDKEVVEKDDFDWSELEDSDDESEFDESDENMDDYFEEGEVTSTAFDSSEHTYGYKPDGKKYYNVRDSKGRFV